MGKLTQEELLVLGLIAHGSPTKEVATKICASVSVVKLRVSAIMEKLDAKNRAHAVIRAYNRGILKQIFPDC